MKKVVLTLVLLCTLIALIGADIYRKDTMSSIPPKKFCKGYTIIEFGKGIDCYGDTLKLVKITGGGQEIASDAKVPS